MAIDNFKSMLDVFSFNLATTSRPRQYPPTNDAIGITKKGKSLELRETTKLHTCIEGYKVVICNGREFHTPICNETLKTKQVILYQHICKL